MTDESKALWSEKYRPKKISEIFGQGEAIRQLMNFLKGKDNAIIIHGPVGCGKTAAVHALANELGYELIEMNAGDLRNRESIKEVMGNALAQRSLFERKKLIFIDEIDNLTNHDYGGMNEINSLLTTSTHKIIMAANKPFEKKLLTIRKKVNLIEFKKANDKDIFEILKKICGQEEVKYRENALRQLALLAGGDIRAAINDLQASGKEVNEVGVSKREQEVSIFSALKTIFKSRGFSVLNALDNVDMELGEAMVWIDENIPIEYRKRDLYEAYKALSLADIFMKRISRNQSWRFLVYANAMMTAGVAFAKEKEKEKENFSLNSYRRSERIFKIWAAQGSQKRETAKKLGNKLHCSGKKVFRELGHLRIICQDSAVKENLRNELNLNNEDIELMLGQKSY